MSALLRRLISVPLVCALAGVLLGALPVLLPALVLVDALRRGRGGLARGYLFLTLFAGAEVAGVVAAALVGADPERNYALQRRWAGALWAGARRIYGLDLRVEADPGVDRGPLLVLCRHATVADTLYPMVLFAIPHDLRPRYVLKQELAWDPCLDIVGHRLPNAFVRRDGRDTEAATAAVRSLAAGLGPRDIVALYPEGTRFTPARRARALGRLGPARRAVAERWSHVLPPRPGGVLALLDAAPGVDLAIVAHTGLERATTLRQLAEGALVGAVVHVRIWRVPAAEVPADREARLAWLDGWWGRMDAWVAERAPPQRG